MEAEWVSVPRVRKDIFGFHFYGVIVKNEEHQPHASLNGVSKLIYKDFQLPQGCLGERAGNPKPPLECLQIGRTDLRIAKCGHLLKGPLRTVFGSFVTGCCGLLFDVGFVHNGFCLEGQ